MTHLRCPWAIHYGVTLHTRCDLPPDHGVTVAGPIAHEGPGLAQFPYQRVRWFPGDRREYRTERADPASWELPA